MHYSDLMATRSPRDRELEAILEKSRQARNFDFRDDKRATLSQDNRELKEGLKR